jgi:arylsulfatase A-like enzyme
MTNDSSQDSNNPDGIDRREFLTQVGKMAGAVGLSAVAQQLIKPQSVKGRATSSGSPPNILIILVDQWRSPIWFPDTATLSALLPNTSALFSQSVNFTNYFTAATACSPSRSTFVTGLYAHQTSTLTTQHNDQAPNLNPGFPTFGTLLRHRGYQAFWFGKWHLSNYDVDSDDVPSLAQYGFSGGTFPSPNGGVGQGQQVDPSIAQQFVQWLNAQSGTTPWCTTVSFINPHDITQYYNGTNTVPGENNPPNVISQMPANFQTIKHIAAKPQLQLAFLKKIEKEYGTLPHSGPGYQTPWLRLLNTYLYCQQLVDQQIGPVLNALASSAYANNTIVIFTADHGEYGGSHGLHDKAGAAYEESIHVPFYVRNLGEADAGSSRSQLCSSVDVVGLLLSLATSSEAWRSAHPYLANRAPMARILRDPSTAGRDYILHTTDEPFALETKSSDPYDADIPVHLIGYRTTAAKLGLYSFWNDGSIDIVTNGNELEFYDYSAVEGAMESKSTPRSNLAAQYYQTLTTEVIPNELRQPLPASLRPYQQQAIQDYLSYLQRLEGRN